MDDLAVNPVHAPLIAIRFVGLRKLLLTSPPQDAEDMWRAVGPTLEFVSIGHWCEAISVDRATMSDFQSHGRNLSTVRFFPEVEVHEVYVGLLMLCGPRLEDIGLTDLPNALLRRILSVCPRVRCGLFMYSDEEEALPYRALGDCMRSIDIDLDIFEDTSYLSVARSSSPNMEEITLSSQTPGRTCADAIRALQLNSKPMLKSLNLLLRGNKDLADALGCIGHGTGELRSKKHYTARHYSRSRLPCVESDFVNAFSNLFHFFKIFEGFSQGLHPGY